MYCQKCQVTITASHHDCVEYKVCAVCKKERDIKEFPVHSSSFDGHRHICSVCLVTQKVQEKVRRTQAKNRETQRREQENHLFTAYGYRWRRGLIDTGWGGYEEGWVLYEKHHGKEISTEAAHAEIARLQAHHPGHASTQWADDLLSLAHPMALLLDTETTGLDKDAEVIELALIDCAGKVYLNTLIECQTATIPQAAMAVHHIYKGLLCNAPTFPQVWMQLQPLLASHEIVIYNAEYDIRLLKQTAQRYGLEMPALRTHCLMQRYSSYVGEKAAIGEGNRHMSLAAACYHFEIEQDTAHRALADVQASLEVLHHLAARAG